MNDETLQFDSTAAHSKYTEEQPRWAEWFIFGEHPSDGTVDVASRHGDVCTHMPRAKAEALVKARDEFLAAARAAMVKDGTYRY